MKKLILLLVLILISSPNSFAGLNSSPGEMKYKKDKALNWYASKANNELYGNSTKEEISVHKDKAMRWYKNRIDVFSNEINSSKKKALSWYEKNSK